MRISKESWELPRIHLLKLSEKGFEQRANRRFGRYAEHEIGKEGASWQPVGLSCERARAFSDGFRR